jgi:hypothetical protein
LLVEAHKHNKNDKQSVEKCIKLLERVLIIVDKQKQKRANKQDKLEYLEAMFNYELAQIKCDGLLNGQLNESDSLKIHNKHSNKRTLKRNTMHPQLFKKLSQVCNVRKINSK